MIKAKKGLTLVEVVACTIILAITTMGVISVTTRINVIKTDARNATYMGLHNLNIMEQVRQMSYAMTPGQQLLSYYGYEATAPLTADSNINTEIYVDATSWGTFNIYNVKIISKMQGYKQTLVSNYTFTDIGRPQHSYSTEGIVS